MRHIRLEGENLFFSPTNCNDYQVITKWMNDETLIRGLGISPLTIITEESERKYLDYCTTDNNKNLTFFVVRKSDEKFLGIYDLHNINTINQTAEVGGFIGEKEERGKGYGSEALRMLCDYAFNVANFRTLKAVVYSFNKASLKSAEKVGFIEVGRLKDFYYYKSKFYDEVILQLDRKNFNNKWKSFVKDCE